MWETDEPQATATLRSNDAQTDPEPPGPAAFLRANPGAQKLLEELRGQVPAAVTAPSTEPLSLPQAPTIGRRLVAELEALERRDQAIREMKALASERVVDLTTDQLRRILQFMA